jgi:Rrf2 family protein
MQLSRTVEYALHATLQLARSQSGMPIPNSKLATNGVMPQRFLLQVLRQLVTHGLLHSTRGVDGGYTLARAPGQITLLDVIEAVEGPLVLAPPSTQTLPEPTWTALRATLDDGVKALRAEYGKLTLARILSDAGLAPVVAQTPPPAKKRWDRPAPPVAGPADAIVDHPHAHVDVRPRP